MTAWRLLVHPAFDYQYQQLLEAAALTQAKVGPDWVKTKVGKQFLALDAIVRKIVPADPAHSRFAMGNTLGPKYRLWRRAKYLQQYRAFFRYSSIHKTVVYAWVNDDQSLRAYGSKNDAYEVFRRMLESGRIPNSWDELMQETKKLS